MPKRYWLSVSISLNLPAFVRIKPTIPIATQAILATESPGIQKQKPVKNRQIAIMGKVARRRPRRPNVSMV